MVCSAERLHWQALSKTYHNWIVEEIFHYMNKIPKGTAQPFHASEYAVPHTIQDFVKSLQLACAGPNNHFWFPDCSVNVMQSLGAALHYCLQATLSGSRIASRLHAP